MRADSGGSRSQAAKPARPRIAVIGLRGVPASWGGVERQCEELYSRLAKEFDVTVYGRRGYLPKGVTSHRGMRVVSLPTIPGKHLEAASHTFFAALHLAFGGYDIVHIYSQGPAMFAPLVRLLAPRAKVFFTCGGLDWRRKKWSGLASAAIQFGEWCSARCTHARVVVSKALEEHYRETYGVSATYIPNGVNIPEDAGSERLAAFGLQPGRYVAFVGRLVPEKRIVDLIDCFRRTQRGLRLVIVGGEAGSPEYAQECVRLGRDANVLFAGLQHGETLAQLFAHARAYVSASELEGLPLAALEAMSYKTPCIVSDIAPHREILGDLGLYFGVGDLAALGKRLDELEAASPEQLRQIGQACQDRARGLFPWDKAAAALAKQYYFRLSSGDTRGEGAHAS
jgi:glycosyltransferase involved in cell wall biosynthesis